MNSLPFLTEPKNQMVQVGTKETGIIELPRYNGLTVAELLFVEKHTAQLPDIRQEAAKLAIETAQAHNVSPLVIYNALLSNNVAVIGQSHLQQAIEFQQLVERVTPATKVAEVTACIRYRLEPDWTVEDTQQMNPQLREAISAFLSKEANGWDTTTPPELTEDQLKK